MLFPYIRHIKRSSLEIWKVDWFSAKNTGMRSQKPILVPEAWTSHSAFVGLSSPIWKMWAFISMGTCNSNCPRLSESSQKGANLAECRQVLGPSFSCASYPWVILNITSDSSDKAALPDKVGYVSDFGHIWKEFFLEERLYQYPWKHYYAPLCIPDLILFHLYVKS